MKENNLTNIKESPYAVSGKPYKEPKKKKEVIGWDSETYDGETTLLGNSNYEYKIIFSSNDFLDFVYKEKFCHSYNFFFNLEYDTNAFIKSLPEKNLKDLKKKDKTDYNGFEIVVIPSKVLKIKDKQLKFCIYFYDIANFYQIGSLSKTVKKVLNLDYEKIVGTEKRKKGFKRNEITEKDIKYCCEDAYYCYLLADNFVKLAHSFVYVPKFISPASLSKALFKSFLHKDYKFRKNNISQYALYSYGGGRFECLKRGFFEDGWIYDINSAYPWELSKLPFPEGVNCSDNKYRSDSLFSYFLVNIKVNNNDLISPIRKYLSKYCLVVYPQGEFKSVYITKREYEYLKDYYKIEIIKAYHILNKEPVFPFKPIVKIYQERQRLKEKGDPKEHILKLSLNALYGILIQLIKEKEIEIEDWSVEDLYSMAENDLKTDFEKGITYLKKPLFKAGSCFSPILATEITSGTRLKLFQDSFNFQDKVIMYATDSITTNGKINLSISNKLGGYKRENKYRMEGVVIGNGLYHFLNPTGKDKMGMRGFGRGLDLFELLESNKRKNYIEFLQFKPIKLKESENIRIAYKEPEDKIFHKKPYKEELIEVKTSPADFNNFFYFEKILKINADRKRLWESDFKDCGQVLKDSINSMPLLQL